MGAEDFQSRSKTWLSQYKREVLDVEEDGKWLRNNRAYSHILPIAQQRLNILPACRNDFWGWFPGKEIRLHKDFHHLNSSQALCFNLFFPLLMSRGPGLSGLLRVLDLTGSPVEGSTFEFEPDRTEGTNFDFTIPLDTGGRVYFELKYTEKGFGTAKEDDRHLRKFESVYRSRVESRFRPPYCTASGFLKNYQILRNVWHLNLASGDTAVFLFPRATGCFANAENIIRSCLLEPLRPHVIIMHIEDLIDELDVAATHRGEPESNSLSEFRLKYFPSAQNQGFSSEGFQETSAAR